MKVKINIKKRHLYVLTTIIIVFIGITYVIAQTSKSKTWSNQADLVDGTLEEDAQINLDLTGTCDARRFLSSGYDYPGHEANPAGTCNWCSGSGTNGIGTSENIPNGQDSFNECDGLECSDYYYGWVGVTCYYRDDVSATNRKCEGDGTCRDAADDCPNQEQGTSTGTSRTTCRTEVGCSGTTAPSLGYVTNGQDTYNDCNGLDCSGYYVQSGTEGPTTTETCKDRANEPAATHNCEGDGTCRDAADDCPGNSGDTTKYTCGTCKYISASSCTGTTLGSCTDYGTSTACSGTLDCDYLNYYHITGTQGATSTSYCKYEDYADTTRKCNAAGSCSALNCGSPSQSNQATAGTCKYISGCSGSTPGTVSNYAAVTGGGTSCGTNKYCRSGTCRNVYVVLDERNTKSCATICSENGGRTCNYIGTNGGYATNGRWWASMCASLNCEHHTIADDYGSGGCNWVGWAGGGCGNQYCGTDPDRHLDAWTYCRCY